MLLIFFWATQTLEISSICAQKGLKGIWTINNTTFEATTTMHFVWYSLICPRIGMVWYLQNYMWKVSIYLFPGRCIEFHNLYIHHKKYHFDIRRISKYHNSTIFLYISFEYLISDSFNLTRNKFHLQYTRRHV